MNLREATLTILGSELLLEFWAEIDNEIERRELPMFKI